MSALRLSAIVLLSQALSADAALAADPPRPPQPPLTDATLHEWSAELQSLHALRDNEFLFDEKAAAFENQVAAWPEADVHLTLQVYQVTKELVICAPLPVGGRILVRNERVPAILNSPPAAGSVPLQIGDVVSLEVAKGLRKHDRIVLRGKVSDSRFDPRLGIKLEIAQAQSVARVSREHAGGNRVYRLNSEIEPQLTPLYPPQALAAGAEGVTVLHVSREEIKIVESAGNSLIDEAAVKALRSVGTRQLIEGEHRVRFRILR